MRSCVGGLGPSRGEDEGGGGGGSGVFWDTVATGADGQKSGADAIW